MIVPLIMVPALWYYQHDARSALRRYVEVQATGYSTGHTALANWLAGNSRAGETVALMDIGIIGHMCQQLRILDITGLTDRYIAKSPGSFLSKQFDLDYLFDKTPKYIILTLHAPGDPDRVPEQGTSFTPWSDTEIAIFSHPSFKANYLRYSATPVNSRDWVDHVAHAWGCDRVFSHKYPGTYYLLCVFRRTGA